jgi:hypothetical protein
MKVGEDQRILFVFYCERHTCVPVTQSAFLIDLPKGLYRSDE